MRDLTGLRWDRWTLPVCWSFSSESCQPLCWHTHTCPPTALYWVCVHTHKHTQTLHVMQTHLNDENVCPCRYPLWAPSGSGPAAADVASSRSQQRNSESKASPRHFLHTQMRHTQSSTQTQVRENWANSEKQNEGSIHTVYICHSLREHGTARYRESFSFTDNLISLKYIYTLVNSFKSSLNLHLTDR